MNKNSQGYKISYMYKLFEAYFNFKLSDSLKILSIIAPKNRPEAANLLKQLFRKDFTNLEYYTDALQEFINYWIKGIPKNKEPWDWFLEFAHKPKAHLVGVLKFAPPSEKEIINERIKAPFNTFDSLQRCRIEFESRLNDPEFGEEFSLADDDFNSIENID